MNQTAWVVCGGVAVVAIAAALFVFSGKNTSEVVVTDASKNSGASVVIKNAATTTDEAITQSPVKKMEANISESTRATLHTNKGDIVVKFYAKDAPNAVANFLKLANEKFYDGVRFHRVIKSFMIQGGDPFSKDDNKIAQWGQGDPGYKFADEINAGSALYQRGYKRGVLAMANSGPNTNGSQFFIMHADYGLPPLYVIFGEVESGLDVIDAIANVPTTGSPSDRPLSPITVTSVTVK